MSELVVIVKCVGCGNKKELRTGEIPPDEQPMCDKCFMPMIPTKAKTKG